jgi:hypothetical protein
VTTPEEVDELEVRVGNGTQWLAGVATVSLGLPHHDPGSRFHCWWQAGFTPATPLPAHEGTPEVKANWITYYKARQVWERLCRKLDVYERAGLSRTLPTAIDWKPESGVRT